MGCDYYNITYLEIYYKDGRKDFIMIDREKHWYVTVDGEEDMTEDDYENCEEKYGCICDDDILVYEKGEFLYKGYYEFYLREIDMEAVDKVVRVNCNEDRY